MRSMKDVRYHKDSSLINGRKFKTPQVQNVSIYLVNYGLHLENIYYAACSNNFHNIDRIRLSTWFSSTIDMRNM